MSKHTPGPWHLDGGTGKNGERYVWTDRDERGKGYIGTHEVCVAKVGGRRFDESQEGMPTLEAILLADARIIAAAPDLLAACVAALEFIRNGREFGYIRMPDPSTPDRAWGVQPSLEAAIAKATGEPA